MITETTVKNQSPLAERIAAQNEIIEKLKQQIKEQREKKRQLERQQRQIDKVVKAAANLELAEDAETINYLWESLTAVLPPKQDGMIATSKTLPLSSEWENYIGSPVRNKETLNRGVLKSLHLEESIAIVEITPNSIAQWPISELELAPCLKSEVGSQSSEVEEENEITPNAIAQIEEELIKNPVKKNTSNDFFAWQPTSNPAIATYFNIKSGRTQAAYFGASNKQRLAEIETKLMKWFPGISCSKRMSQRLTEYKYELKVVGWHRVPNFDDSDFGWLCGMYDPLQPLGVNVKDYLCCRMEDNPALDIEF